MKCSIKIGCKVLKTKIILKSYIIKIYCFFKRGNNHFFNDKIIELVLACFKHFIVHTIFCITKNSIGNIFIE